MTKKNGLFSQFRLTHWLFYSRNEKKKIDLMFKIQYSEIHKNIFKKRN